MRASLITIRRLKISYIPLSGGSMNAPKCRISLDFPDGPWFELTMFLAKKPESILAKLPAENRANTAAIQHNVNDFCVLVMVPL